MSEQPKSLFITSALVKIVFVIFIAAPFFIPWAASWYDSVSMQEPIFWPLCICLYLTLVPAFILIFCLNRILSNVKTGAVFTAGTVKMATRNLLLLLWQQRLFLPSWEYGGFWRCFYVLPPPSWDYCCAFSRTCFSRRCSSAKKTTLQFRGEASCRLLSTWMS